jgi:conjugative transfer region protein TrbK
MDPSTSLRIGIAGLLGLGLFVAASAQHGAESLEPVRTLHSVVPADPLAAELTRCRKLGLEAAGKQACEDAWAQNRSRFFSSPNASMGR